MSSTTASSTTAPSTTASSTDASSPTAPSTTAPATPLLALAPAAQDLLFREARTANAFTAEPVTDAQVQAIYDLVKYGPTAFN